MLLIFADFLSQLIFYLNNVFRFLLGFGGLCGVRSAECGVRSVENAECGKWGVWKMRSVENAECGKWGVWKVRSVENASIFHFKMRSVENASIFHFNFSFPCGKTLWNWNVNKLIKKRDASLHFLDAQFVLYTNVPVYTNVLTPDTITWLFVCCPLIKICRRCHLQIRMNQAQWKSLRGRELHKARTAWIYMQCCTARPPVSFVMSKLQKQNWWRYRSTL